MVNTKPNITARIDQETDAAYSALMVGYRQHLRARGLADGTIAQRLLHIAALHGAHPDLLTVTTSDMERYLSRRRHTHAAESRRSMRSSWQSFYGWLVKSGRLEESPAADLNPIRLPRMMARIADDSKVASGLRGATTRDEAMVLLGRLAALRLSEITMLHTSDREGEVLRIRGKGEHIRLVPINPELLTVLVRLEQMQGEGYYFRGREGGPMHPMSVNKIITRLTGCNPHSLRHAALTAAYEGTHDIRAVQEFAGHASLATTERYLHVRADQIRAAAMATTFR